MNDESDDNKYNEKLESVKSRSVRHLILIRHGQYHMDKKVDKERILTPLGNFLCTRYNECSIFQIQRNNTMEEWLPCPSNTNEGL